MLKQHESKIVKNNDKERTHENEQNASIVHTQPPSVGRYVLTRALYVLDKHGDLFFRLEAVLQTGP